MASKALSYGLNFPGGACPQTHLTSRMSPGGPNLGGLHLTMTPGLAKDVYEELVLNQMACEHIFS